ncbi:MAG: Na/Pi cotransporter family protein [Ruminococcaceae bacterium]|nr:Na/Pi cotransporter family protein [Oscillospiraceae bacterium]
MDIFDILTLVGGLCLFLFGMDLMGQGLERRAGNSLRSLLSKLTTKKMIGLLTGLGVTAVIQSSSATTVMVVGFVNSGLMTLKQAINVIMGANIGTTVTSWILSLSGIESSNMFVKLLKPTSFTPVLALIGIIFYLFCKSRKRKDTGTILLGFATLMFGMDTMSDAVSGLADVPAFQQLFLMFTNPILGVLVGAILTAIIQSSSASVGILQALAATGQVSYGAAIPIIMGQNIGTCITAILSSFGTNKNAKRAAMVHLFFNIIGTVILLTVFWIVKITVEPILLSQSASLFGIAVVHSVFNLICTCILFPMSGVLETIAYKLVPESKKTEENAELDKRLLDTPPIALEISHNLTIEMGKTAVQALKDSIKAFGSYSKELAAAIKENEVKNDHYEDILGTYLVQLSGRQLNEQESIEVVKMLKVIGDFERISDHSVNILESVEELREKEIAFTEGAKKELNIIFDAVNEILDLSLSSFVNNDLHSAFLVEPLEQIIDELKEKLRTSHITRLQQGECTIAAGFIWSDLLTNLERTSDHCSNIAGCVFDTANNNMNLHESLQAVRNNSEEYHQKYQEYKKKYIV